MQLKEFRKVYSGLIIGNVGYDQKTAEETIRAGYADMIAFGRPWISNPDLPERFKKGYPLADFSDASKWYGGGEEGYSDYPTYKHETDKLDLETLGAKK